MGLTVTLIQGGGAGLDQIPAVKEVVAAAGVAVTWDEHFAGWAAVEKGLPALPDAMLASIRKNRVALKTKLLPPPGVAHKTASDLYATLKKAAGGGKVNPAFARQNWRVNMTGHRHYSTAASLWVVKRLIPGPMQPRSRAGLSGAAIARSGW